MRPSTSTATGNTTASNYFVDSEALSGEDCRYLLRALEKKAFEHVIFALRAQGPLTQYKELLLEHVKSALFITDEDFTLHARIAANNPYLAKIAKELNPSYDNFSEWIAAGFDLTGVELARARKSSLDKNNSHFASKANTMLREIHKHNRNLNQESEQFMELYRIPKRPYVPERLRKFLQDTEDDTATRIDINIATNENASATAFADQPSTSKKSTNPTGAGRPRKNARKNAVKSAPKQAAQFLPPPPPIVKQKQPTVDNNINVTNVHNNVTNQPPRKPIKTLDEKSAKTPEEAAVLAILAKSSAQISQQEAEMRQNSQQKSNNITSRLSQEVESTSTKTTAMESLAEAAFAQVPVPVAITSSDNSHQQELVRPISTTQPVNLIISPTQPSHVTFVNEQPNNSIFTASIPSYSAPLPSQNLHQQQPEILNIESNKLLGSIGNNIHENVIPPVSGLANHSKNDATLKKKRRPSRRKDPALSQTSARTRPFIFARSAPGQPKIPRGDPDKIIQAQKRSTDMAPEYIITNNSSVGFPVISPHSQQSQPSFPQFHLNSNYYSHQTSAPAAAAAAHQMRIVKPSLIASADGTYIIDYSKTPLTAHPFAESYNSSSAGHSKFAASTSIPPMIQSIPTNMDVSTRFSLSQSAPGLAMMAAKNDHSRTTTTITSITTNPNALFDFTPAPGIIGSSGNSSTPELVVVNDISAQSYTPIDLAFPILLNSHIPNFQQQPFIQPNGIYSNGLNTSAFKLNSTNPTSSKATDRTTATVPTPMPMSLKVEETRLADAKNTDVEEASGLDFLASTASMLAPMETNVLNNLQQRDVASTSQSCLQ